MGRSLPGLRRLTGRGRRGPAKSNEESRGSAASVRPPVAFAAEAVRLRGVPLSSGSPEADAAAGVDAAPARALTRRRPRSTASRPPARPPGAPSAHRDNVGTGHAAVRARSSECGIASTPGSPDQPNRKQTGNGRSAAASTPAAPTAIHSFHRFMHSGSRECAPSPQARSTALAVGVDSHDAPGGIANTCHVGEKPSDLAYFSGTSPSVMITTTQSCCDSPHC